MTVLRSVTIITLLCALGACSSAPSSDYYILSALEEQVPTGSTPDIGIGPVTVPEYLERENLISSRDSNQLEVAGNSRWAEPLADGILRVMSINLAGMLDTQQVQRFPWRRDQRPDYAIRVDVLLLDAADNEARLIAEWSLQTSARPEDGVQRRTHLSVPLAAPSETRPTEATVAQAYSELFFQLSRMIAGEIPARPPAE